MSAGGFYSRLLTSLLSKDNLQDVAQPIDIGSLDWIILEKVVLHERYAAAFKSLRVLLWPDFFLRLFQDGPPILNDEAQVGI